MSKESIMEGYTDSAVILRADTLHIYIQDIKISSRSGILKDEEWTYDSTTKKYFYEVMSNIPVEFTEEELIQYLHDRRKIVDFVIYFSVKIAPGKIGTLLSSGKDVQ